MREFDKMLQGKWYDANYDAEIVEKRAIADELCFDYNNMRPSKTSERLAILKQLVHNLGEAVTVLSPVYFDYGFNTVIKDYSFINHNVYFMDGGKITIGKHVFIGPNTGFYTANHALDASERNRGLEQASGITVGDNTWIGADVTVLGGVTIGKNVVIGAKSLVNKDIPDNVIAVGNPIRILRKITEADKLGDLIETV